jgi:SPP1 family predicted phage head-tail adaptor
LAGGAKLGYVEAGTLKRPITIIDPTLIPAQSQDKFGGPATGQEFPALVGSDWASIVFEGTATLYSAQQASAQVTHRVTIRWRPGIKGAQQIYYIDDSGVERLLQIRAVENPDEGMNFLVLACLERADLLAMIESIPGIF